MSKRLSHETPELHSLAVAHAEPERDAGQRPGVTNDAIASLRFWSRLRHTFQALERAIVVLASVVDRPQDLLVAFYEPRRIHSRYEVQIRVRVVPPAFAKQPPFSAQPSPELRVRQRRQQPDHR